MYYENFEKLCHNNGVKPADVSKATGISTATLSNWKKGNYTPKQDKLQIIADYFNVSVDFLMTGKESPFTVEMAKTDVELSKMSKRIKLYALMLDKMSEDNQKLITNLMDKLNNDKKDE